MPRCTVVLDSNVYNHVCDVVDWEGGRLPKRPRGLRILLTPANVYEVLQAPEVRRERLIRLMQRFCDLVVVADVSEMFVSHMAHHMGSGALKRFQLSTIASRGVISHAWRDIKADRLKTFVFEPEAIGRLRDLKLIYAWAHAVLSRGKRLGEGEGVPDLRGLTLDKLRETTMASMQMLRRDCPPAVRHELWADSAHFVALLFCAGLVPDDSVLEEFWTTLGLTEVFARLEFLQGPGAFAYSSGPIPYLARLMSWQVGRKHSWGNLFDTYLFTSAWAVDRFYTLDGGILAFAYECLTLNSRRRILSASSLVRRLGNR